MQIRPKRLGVCQRGVDGRDERGAPQVGRRPPIRTEFGGGGEREGGGVEEGDEPGEEEAAVGDDLSCQAHTGTGTGTRVRGGEDISRRDTTERAYAQMKRARVPRGTGIPPAMDYGEQRAGQVCKPASHGCARL